MRAEIQQVNIAAIRKLLLAAFTPEELRRFCWDRPQFRPVVARFGPRQGLDDMVDRVLEHCETRLLWPEFLDEVKSHNPRQYARFESELRRTPVSAKTSSAPAPRRSTRVRRGRGDVPPAASCFQAGNEHKARGDLRAAIDSYNRAIAFDPQFHFAYYNRANAYAELGDTARAIADFRRYQELEGDPLWRDEAETRIKQLQGQ